MVISLRAFSPVSPAVLAGALEAVLLPLDAYFAAYPAYRIPSTGKEVRVRNGNPITDSRVADGTYRVYGADGAFLCLSQAKGGCLTAIKNFFGT